MTVSAEFVRKVFRDLETGDGVGFFEHVADDVDPAIDENARAVIRGLVPDEPAAFPPRRENRVSTSSTSIAGLHAFARHELVSCALGAVHGEEVVGPVGKFR